MKDYLVCFKKVECRGEIRVRVGGLPREVPRVLGTSIVHYELIREGGCAGSGVCIEKGKRRMDRKTVSTCFCVWFMCVCACVMSGRCVRRDKRGLTCVAFVSCGRRQDPPGRSPWWLPPLMNMGQTPPASRCSQLNTSPKTDIHPYSHRALCTAHGTCCVKNMI